MHRSVGARAELLAEHIRLVPGDVSYQSQSTTCQMKLMDFFGLQDEGRVDSPAIDDEPNAARWKETRSHGALWVGIGIRPCIASCGAHRSMVICSRNGCPRQARPAIVDPCLVDDAITGWILSPRGRTAPDHCHGIHNQQHDNFSPFMF
jgi:hypothetical protein